jgi:hypothetical protein
MARSGKPNGGDPRRTGGTKVPKSSHSSTKWVDWVGWEATLGQESRVVEQSTTGGGFATLGCGSGLAVSAFCRRVWPRSSSNIDDLSY